MVSTGPIFRGKVNGVTHEEVAELLSQIVSGTTDHYQIQVGDEKFDVRVTAYRGFQECPFFKHGDDGKYVHPQPIDRKLDMAHRGSCNYNITNMRTRKSIGFGGLLVHLIRVHKFFEGKGTGYRLPPEDVIRFFGMERGARSATVIESPSYRYENYAMSIFGVLWQIKSLYSGNIDIDSFTGEEGLRAFSEIVDQVAFVAPAIRDGWKQRAAEIVDNLGPKDESSRARWAAKRAELDELTSEIEAEVIRSTGFVPLQYHCKATAAKLPPDLGCPIARR